MKKIEPYSATLLVLAEDRRLKKGARTRLRLLSATAALLQETYFHSLRIADICQAANVSQGTFYLYFTDKMDITSKLLSDFTQMVYQELDGAKSKSVDPYDTIHAPTRAYVELFYQNRGLMRCLTQMTE